MPMKVTIAHDCFDTARTLRCFAKLAGQEADV
jgi:hypothetical protein